MKKLIITLIIVAIVVLGGIYGFFKNQIQAVDSSSHGIKIVNIKTGSGTDEIASQLKKENLIKNETVFKLLVKIKGSESDFKAGSYAFSQDMDSEKIIDVIAKGKVAGKTFSVIPGQSLGKIAAALENGNICSKKEFFKEVEKGKFNYRFMKLLPKGTRRLEGFLYPDTYSIPLKAGAHEAIDAMLNQFDKVVYEKYASKVEKKGMKFFNVITTASIIERESQKKEDKAKAADVIYNRIKKGMYLQMDSIISYIKNEDKVIASYSDIAVESAYNPYKNKGLPPGPICSPSIDSIEAALNPAGTTYLFFVNSPKLDGSLAFSENDKDFEKNKAAFEKAYKKYLKEHPKKK